jgi:hypothetical protein
MFKLAFHLDKNIIIFIQMLAIELAFYLTSILRT